MPEALNRRTYAIAPVFLGQQLRPEPVYRNVEMRSGVLRAATSEVPLRELRSTLRFPFSLDLPPIEG